MPRFVILRHDWRGVHWDVMLEREGALRTWSVAAPIAAGPSQPARLLPVHRLAYLDYEGPVSGNRGTVRRVAEGHYTAREWSDGRVVVLLDGPRLRGEAELSRDAGGAWSLAFRPGKAD